MDGLDAQRLFAGAFENRAVLYNTSGGSAGERASYDFGGGTLVSVSNTGNGAALLLSNGQTSTAVLLDGELTVGYSGSVLSASQIIRAKNDGFYLLTDSTVERFNNVGEFQWSQPLSRPRALIEGRQIMVLSGNTVQESHRRSRQLPADSDFWVRRSCGNQHFCGESDKK